MRRSILTIVIVAIVAVGAAFFGGLLPAGFIPEEDQGIVGINVTLPPGSSLERTSAVLAQVEEIVGKTEGIDSYQTIGGYGVVTSTYQPNFGTIFVRLHPWEERHGDALHARGIMAAWLPQLARIPEAVIFPFNIPTISGFGASAGFNFLLQDRSGSLTVDQLGALARDFQEAARARSEIGNIFTSFDPLYPQVKVDLDRDKARKLGVPIDEAFQALASSLGGTYVNDFNRFGRLFRVYVQADADYRRKPEDIGEIYVRSKTSGDMVPLDTIVTITSQSGTEITNRFNLLRSVELQGVPARGYASGQALAALEEVFRETMPPEISFAYSSLSYQEKTAPPAGPTFVAAIVFVFLLLAALYESWRLPWAVLLGSPLVALGAFFGVWLLGYDNNVYVQIGNIMLIGLAAKNAILIVEFAKAKHDNEGMSFQDAALESARLRFRPILMTAFAFILGVVPLMRASGAGAGSAERDGDGGLLRHAGGHRSRRLPDPRQLRLRRRTAGARRSWQRSRRSPRRHRPRGRTDHATAMDPRARARPAGVGLHRGAGLRTAAGGHARAVATDGRGAGIDRERAVVGSVPGRAAADADHHRPGGEPRPADRRRAHRGSTGALRLQPQPSSIRRWTPTPRPARCASATPASCTPPRPPGARTILRRSTRWERPCGGSSTSSAASGERTRPSARCSTLRRKRSERWL